LVEDFSVKVVRGDISKPIIDNENLHEVSNGTEFRVINFTTPKNLIFKNTTFPHGDIHKHTWTFPDGVTHNQIDYVSVDRRRHSNLLDVRSFKGADSVIKLYLVVVKLKERISVSKRARQKFGLERCDLKKLNNVEVKGKNEVEI
jgi:hypothetical protein